MESENFKSLYNHAYRTHGQSLQKMRKTSISLVRRSLQSKKKSFQSLNERQFSRNDFDDLPSVLIMYMNSLFVGRINGDSCTEHENQPKR